MSTLEDENTKAQSSNNFPKLIGGRPITLPYLLDPDHHHSTSSTDQVHLGTDRGMVILLHASCPQMPVPGITTEPVPWTALPLPWPLPFEFGESWNNKICYAESPYSASLGSWSSLKFLDAAQTAGLICASEAFSFIASCLPVHSRAGAGRPGWG